MLAPHAASFLNNESMRKTITFTLLAVVAFTAQPTLAQLPANALYQWQSQDGTPTYSPDPPPAGVKYVVVDADLNPLPVQPAPSTVATGVVTAPAPAALPAPKKSIPKWKPVRYAQDPNAKPAASSQAIPVAATASAIAASQEANAGINTSPLSAECQLMKRETQILESYFAEAKTASEMDQAILKLQKKNNDFRQQCQ